MGMVQTLPSPLKNMMMKDMDADTKRPVRTVRCAEVFHCYASALVTLRQVQEVRGGPVWNRNNASSLWPGTLHRLCLSIHPTP